MAKRVLLACDVGEPFSGVLEELFVEEDWRAEHDCYEALKKLGYEVRTVAIFNDLAPIFNYVTEFKPDVIFNQVDHFNNLSLHDHAVASVYELLNVPYTGAGPAGLTLCKDKALTKELLTAHRIKVPQFAVFYRGKKVAISKHMRFPQIIKPLNEEASYGIVKDSLVMTPADMLERVRYLHEHCQHDVIAEEYIEGIELYVSLLGNERLEVLPLRQCSFPTGEGAPQFATFKVKWDQDYRNKWGIKYGFADLGDKQLEKRVREIAKRVYRVLRLQGYGRLDVRLAKDGNVFVIEANPNPYLARDEDFAISAEKAGYPFEELIARIVKFAEDAHPRSVLR